MRQMGWLWIVMAGFHGACAVALGAYAAHGMADADAYVVSLMEKATRYQMVHALALIAVAGVQIHCVAHRWPSGWFALSGALLAVGTFLFCGVLYAIALAGWQAAALAPYGGMSLIAGWLALVVGGLLLRKRMITV
jgi:uncharacterized membrane protein YgdD (TMEM256/DUF423 family)